MGRARLGFTSTTTPNAGIDPASSAERRHRGSAPVDGPGCRSHSGHSARARDRRTNCSGCGDHSPTEVARVTPVNGSHQSTPSRSGVRWSASLSIAPGVGSGGRPGASLCFIAAQRSSTSKSFRSNRNRFQSCMPAPEGRSSATDSISVYPIEIISNTRWSGSKRPLWSQAEYLCVELSLPVLHQETDIVGVRHDFGHGPILLQKSLMAFANGDSVALMRFAAEASDDGAAQPGPGAAFLFVLPR